MAAAGEEGSSRKAARAPDQRSPSPWLLQQKLLLLLQLLTPTVSVLHLLPTPTKSVLREWRGATF